MGYRHCSEGERKEVQCTSILLFTLNIYWYFTANIWFDVLLLCINHICYLYMPSWGPDLVDKLIYISISIYKANVVYLDCKIDNTIKKIACHTSQWHWCNGEIDFKSSPLYYTIMDDFVFKSSVQMYIVGSGNYTVSTCMVYLRFDYFIIKCVCDIMSDKGVWCTCSRGHRGRDRMVVGIPLRWVVLDTTLCDKVCQWLTTGRWFSPGTPVSSTNKTDRHDMTEILLRVALKPHSLNPNLAHAVENLGPISIPRVSLEDEANRHVDY